MGRIPTCRIHEHVESKAELMELAQWWAEDSRTVMSFVVRRTDIEDKFDVFIEWAK